MKNLFRKVAETIKSHKVISAIGIIVLLFVVVAILFFSTKFKEKEKLPADSAKATETQAIKDGKRLSNDQCEGEEKPKITNLPMNEADFSYIIPYGMTVGDHVTPIDHQYFEPTVFRSARDTYPVYAMADAKLVDIGKRDKPDGDYEYRLVFSMSCKLFYYYDLVTSLTPEIKSKMTGDRMRTPIDVKAGQQIGWIGGQTLDFAVWDMDVNLSGFTVPEHYLAEPWKIHTADPLLYYTDELKKKIIAKYIRTAEPISGKIDYDVDGKLIGSWFQDAKNGYGPTTGANFDAHKGHFSFAPEHIDPTRYIFSIGDYAGESKQFAVKGNAPSPAEVSETSGVVKYELVQQDWVDESGSQWNRWSFAKGLKAKNNDYVVGAALVQMIEKRKIKLEVFPGKKGTEVSGFTSNAKEYVR